MASEPRTHLPLDFVWSPLRAQHEGAEPARQVPCEARPLERQILPDEPLGTLDADLRR